jgi:Ca-activated chloride channel family protein
MGFLSLSSFLLTLGGLLALGILISYLLRPSRPTRRVSSSFLWLAAFHELHADRPWRRVPPSVFLLVQLLALAAIVAALARPYVLSAEGPGLDAIVLLDVSASMQATDVQPNRFEAARSKAQDLIDQLQPGQTLSLVSLGAEPRVVAPRTADHDALRQALASLHATTQSANLPAALSLAASLAEGHPEAQVVIVGGGALDRSQVPPGLPFGLRFIGVGSAAPNLAIASFGTRAIQGHLATLARVANYGAERRTATLELKVDGNRFDTRLLGIDPGSSAEAQWDDLPSGARVLEARLAESDALALDNTAWAVVGGDRPTRVLLVTTGNVFLERALGLRRGVEVSRTSLSDYTPEPAGGQPYDLVVFDGFLPAALPQGGSLLLLHPPANNPIVPAFQDVSVSRVEATRRDDPLLDDVELSGAHVNRARRLQTPAWADTVLESPETPLLLVGEQGGHRVAVLAFDVHQSDLPLQPAFPVLMQHVLEWLVPSESVATPVVRVGESAALVPLPATQSLDVIAPDGRQARVAPPLPAPPFSDTEQPGVYQVVQRDAKAQETKSLFAANFFNAGESRLLAAQTTSIAPSTRANAAQSGVLAPSEVWQIAAAVALVLLAVEWWIFQRQ